MRKGYSLVEVITVLAVILALSVPLARLSRVTLWDIPKSQKLIESNTSILNVLKYIKKDVNSAKGLPRSFQEYAAGENCLLIERQNETVCYLFKEGKISRIVIGGARGEITWQIPGGKIEWRVWRRDRAGYAVEIRKYVELKSHSHTERKMENSYVYFAGAYKEAVN